MFYQKLRSMQSTLQRKEQANVYTISENNTHPETSAFLYRYNTKGTWIKLKRQPEHTKTKNEYVTGVHKDCS